MGEATGRRSGKPAFEPRSASATQGPQCQVVNWDSSEQPLDNISCAALTNAWRIGPWRYWNCRVTRCCLCSSIFSVLQPLRLGAATSSQKLLNWACWQKRSSGTFPRNDDSGGPACDCSESAEFTSASLMTRGKKDAVSFFLRMLFQGSITSP